MREQQYQLSFPVCAINARIEKVLKPLPENEKNKKPEYIFKVYPNIEQDGCLSHYTKDSYHGGNCIKISPLKDFGQCKIRLFLCEFKCDQNFVIYYIYKRLDGVEQNLDLLLSMKNNTTKHGFEVNLSSSEVSRSSDPFHFNSINLENKHFTNLKNNLKLYYPSYYISDLSDNWEIK